ncbi:MAG: response regulator [Candidatus Magnetominusculus sp. LBB02]|nr:response regulator [Candidatus Magnetominusculus sp. LBB02]
MVKAKILVVDDDRTLLDSVVFILKREGCEVSAAASGMEALELLKNDSYDTVLSDINMPGMSGLELIEAIKLAGVEIPVILMTAFVEIRTTIEAIRKNAFDFIIKPYEPHALILAVEKAVRFNQLVNMEKNYKITLESMVQQRTKELSDALADNKILLKEVHHRVRNNLQVISSLLNLQAETITDKDVQTILMASQMRIKSIAHIYKILYQSDDISKLDFEQYIEELSSDILDSYSIFHNGNVNLGLDICVKMIDVDIAVPCALIVCELVSNSLKYAFSIDQGGHIWISFVKRADDKLELTVGDNGIGLPDDTELKKCNSLGIKLVYDLTTVQLKGSVEIDRTNGTTFKMLF